MLPTSKAEPVKVWKLIEQLHLILLYRICKADFSLAAECPSRRRMPGTGERVSPGGAPSGLSPRSRELHIVRAPLGGELSSGPQDILYTSSCYFLGFSRMLRNFPLVISLAGITTNGRSMKTPSLKKSSQENMILKMEVDLNCIQRCDPNTLGHH